MRQSCSLRFFRQRSRCEKPWFRPHSGNTTSRSRRQCRSPRAVAWTFTASMDHCCCLKTHDRDDDDQLLPHTPLRRRARTASCPVVDLLRSRRQDRGGCSGVRSDVVSTCNAALATAVITGIPGERSSGTGLLRPPTQHADCKLLRTRNLDVAERVGFVPARNEPQASCGVPETSLDDKTERSEGLAEMVGFEPDRTP
jgi:hypothetical protein